MTSMKRLALILSAVLLLAALSLFLGYMFLLGTLAAFTNACHFGV